MVPVLISVGSNLNDPVQQVQSAMERLEIKFGLLERSSLYETEPVGLESEQNFINAAVLLKTDLSALETLDELAELESRAGRVRSAGSAYQSRELDLDIILYGDDIVDDDIKIPHPRFRQRRFVLDPAGEIAPDMRDPVSGMTVQQLLDACADTNWINKLEPEVQVI